MSQHEYLHLVAPVVVDQCRLDALVVGPDGHETRPYMLVVLTPVAPDLPGEVIFPKVPAAFERHFRGVADSLRDAVEGGR